MKTTRSPSSGRVVPDEIKTHAQLGWGCDLYAIASSLDLLYTLKKIETKPLPARKRDLKLLPDNSTTTPRIINPFSILANYALTTIRHLGESFSPQLNPPKNPDPKVENIKDSKGEIKSLRQYAKRYLESKIGEIYDEEKLCRLITNTHPEAHVATVQAKERDIYCHTLIEAVQRKAMAIVFFDVTVGGGRHGQPKVGEGSAHAAVVVGYSRGSRGNLQFQLLQWGKEFTVSADELFASASQLRVNATVDETFFKIKTRTTPPEGCWLPMKMYRGYRGPKFTRDTNPHKLGSDAKIQNKILILDSRQSSSLSEIQKMAVITLIGKLNWYLRHLDSNSCKAKALIDLRENLNSNVDPTKMAKTIQAWKDAKQNGGPTNWQTLTPRYAFFSFNKSKVQQDIEECAKTTFNITSSAGC
jgi:hypothetical protein